MTNEQWSCFLYGDIAETCSNVGFTPAGSGWITDDNEEVNNNNGNGNGNAQPALLHNFKVVKGFKYKQLNSGLECTVDVNGQSLSLQPLFCLYPSSLEPDPVLTCQSRNAK